MANFKVDVLLKTLDELQKEKTKNEQVLAKESARRKKLEFSAQTVMSTLAQASERNAKMIAEVKLEEQGEEETQKKIEQFEQVNESIRLRITRLNQQIKEIEDRRCADQIVFEKKMSQLIDQFRSGWQSMEGNTEDEIQLYSKEKKLLQENIESNKFTLEQLTTKLEKAKTTQTTHAGGTPHTEWKETCELLEAENKASRAALEKTHEELNIEKLEEELAELANQNSIHV